MTEEQKKVKKVASKKKKEAPEDQVDERKEPEANIQMKQEEHKPVVKKSKAAISSAARKFFGTGRRKEATAKVWLVPGNGKIFINDKDFSEYFCRRRLLEVKANRPLLATQTNTIYDVFAQVLGGGVAAQADAVSLGIARAIIQASPELKSVLKKEGLMTRDPRMKERKKYGLKRARKAFQYTKR